MAESTLTEAYADFRRHIGRFLGYGRNADDWTADEIQDVADILESGLRQFYSPPPVNGRPSHNWSFLRPAGSLTLAAPYTTGTIAIATGVVTLTGGTWPSNAADQELTVSGTTYAVASRDSGTQITLTNAAATAAAGTSYSLSQDLYDLPDDFGVLAGDVYYQTGFDRVWPSLQQVAESNIRKMKEDGRRNFGEPLYFAIVPKAHDATVGTRWQMLIHPAPDSSRILTYRYRVNADALTSSNIYPHGGMVHAETMKQSCLAIAEQEKEGTAGIHTRRFEQMLAASIQRDQETATPNLGQSGGRASESAADYFEVFGNTSGYTLIDGRIPGT